MIIASPEQTFLSTCPVCQEQIDVSSLEPFTKLKCPSCGQMVRVRRRFDHFMIVRQIGEGGMSRVFEAEDETLGRRVALKILNRTYSRDAARLEQFHQEALITASITHPNVIKLYSVGYDQGYFYLAMELVGGGSLEQRIRRESKLSEGDALRIGHEVAEGLRAAQHQGLLHRDVKPANILFTETGTAKVVDFGLALFTDRGPDKSAEIWATPYYVAPEKLLHNQEDYRSDIFSLGATLFHALTGSPPHQVDTHAIEDLRRIKSRRVTLGDSGLRFAPRTEHVINHMLSFKPEDRFANYDEVVDELRLADGLLNQTGIRRRLISRRARLIGAVAASIMLAFLVGWLLGEGRQRSTTKSIARQLTTVEPASLVDGVMVPAGSRKTVTEKFLEARHLMLQNRQFAEAQHQFDRIADSKDTRQPTQCWARFNAALCALMLGDRKHAEEAFRDLTIQGADKETVAASNGLGVFFVTVGRRMEKGLGLGTSQSKLGYNVKNEELLGYLAQGLAEWHFGDAEAGARVMEFFQSSLAELKKASAASLTDSYDWVAFYGVLVDFYKADFHLLRTALKQRKVNTLDELSAALAEVRQTREKIKSSGAFRNSIEQMEAGLKRELARVRLEEQTKQRHVEDTRRKADLAQLTEVTALLPSLVHGFDYSRAIELLRGLSFETTDVRAAVEGRLYLYTSAHDFTKQLQLDLVAQGWSGTLTQRSGVTLTGSVSLAVGSKDLSIKVDEGTLSIPFESIAPHSLIEMAQGFTAKITDSTEYYRRQELAATFARAEGLGQLSSTLAAQLMEENRSFRSRWMKVMEAGI
ncbi:MAG: serine/threonine-protein kinase [Prosthecobacter sp.]